MGRENGNIALRGSAKNPKPWPPPPRWNAAPAGSPLSTTNRDQLREEGRAPGTVNLAIKILKIPLNLARRQGLIASKPAEAIEMLSADTVEKGVFSPEAVSSLLKAAKWEWQGLILAGFYTGSRAGDLANLKWSSVDMARKTISFGQRKTKRFVEIPIHAEIEKWLVEEFKQRPNAEFVFPKFAGKPIGSRGGISGQFPLLVKKAGHANLITAKAGEKGRARSSLTFHSLRHSFNSAMANAGFPRKGVSSSPAMPPRRSTTATPTPNWKPSGRRSNQFLHPWSQGNHGR